jgi:branched-chain amino acid transport system substrate-binding protein
LALTLVVAGAFAGCTSEHKQAAAPEPTEIVLGAIYPTSGPLREGGTQEWRGVKLAVERINARGGVHGKKVRLVFRNAPTRERVAPAIDELQRAGVRVVLGTYSSAVSEVASAELARRDMLLWETGAVGLVPRGAQAGRRFFRIAPTGATLGVAAADFVTAQLAPALHAPRKLRWAAAYVNDAFGRAVVRGAIADLRRRHQPVVGAFRYDPHSVKMADLVKRIAKRKPDVLFVTAYLQDGIKLRRAMIAQKLKVRVNIGTSSSYCMEDFGEALGGQATGLFASDKADGDHVREAALAPEARTLLRWGRAKYRARFHEAMPAAALSGLSNTWALVQHVLGAATSTDPDAVASAALATKLSIGRLPSGSGLDLVGPSGADAGTNRAATSVIWEWVKPETRAVVWPPTFATSNIKLLPS